MSPSCRSSVLDRNRLADTFGICCTTLTPELRLAMRSVIESGTPAPFSAPIVALASKSKSAPITTLFTSTSSAQPQKPAARMSRFRKFNA